MLNAQMNADKSFVDKIKDQSYYDVLMNTISPLFMNVYFKYDNSSIKIANFYEVLLKASDLNTEKKIMKGFGFEEKEFGEVEIKSSGIKVGSIGNKSDLIWNIFYNDFIDEDENGEIKNTHDHDKYVTLQIWNADEIDNDNLNNYVQQILFYCSVRFELNFKRTEVDELYKERGKANIYSLDFQYEDIEDIPLLYFNSTIEDTSIRLKFLSYYQVIEYYYIRANNILLRNEFIEEKLHEKGKFNSIKMTILMKKYKKNLSEREAIKLVLGKAIDVDKLKAWISEEVKRAGYYTNNQQGDLKKFNVNMNGQDNEFINKLCNRIYSIRCSIVHSKADSSEVIYIPNLNDVNIPLMKYVAIRVLETWGVNATT